MSRRAEARILARFAERQEPPITPRPKRQSHGRLQDWMEEWYWAGKTAESGWSGSRASCEHISKRLYRGLRALRSMTDEQYVAIRQRRIVHPDSLDHHEINGVLLSPRGIEIHELRSSLHSLEERLSYVVESLPQWTGRAVDQDHFHLRSWNPRRPWYVNWRFASYISLERRLKIYKEMRRIERGHEARYREERIMKRRAEAYPKLLKRIRTLKARIAQLSNEA